MCIMETLQEITYVVSTETVTVTTKHVSKPLVPESFH
jgi:hypothetical protein